MSIPRGVERSWVRAVVWQAAVLLLLLNPGAVCVAVGQSAPGDAAPAATEPPRREESGDGPAILAGQEAVLGPMVGMSETLPGQCRMAGANIDRNIITVTYNCSGGDVVVTLRHISTAPSGATKTEHFGIAVESGAPPEGFVDALVKLVRAHEAKVQWMWPTGAAGRPRRFPSLSLIVAGVALVGVAVGVLARRRRTR